MECLKLACCNYVANEVKEKMKKRSPCPTCPFRSNINFHLTAGKAQAVLSALQNDGDFPCHNTIPVTGKPPHQSKGCIGAAIFLEHVRAGGLRANRAFRLREGWFREFTREELDLDSPVYRDVDAFVTAKTQRFSPEA